MSVRRQITESNGIYFISFTCYNWLYLIEMVNGNDLVYKWYDYLKMNHHHIIGYVIMPNHVHSLIAFSNSRKSINSIIGNAKRFMAYEIVDRLSELRKYETLAVLKNGVNASDKKSGKIHQVFEPSFDWKECQSNHFIEQKLNYMHENPCVGKWKLAGNPADYLHSSARFYIDDQPGVYEVTNYMELEDIDLTKLVR